jgi:signal transduction histidine kinase
MDGRVEDGVRQVDLDEIVLDRVEAVRARGKVAVRLTPFEAARLPGRPEELRRVVDCLLDNAERHAVRTVVVGLSAEDDHVDLVVSDDGAGIPAAERERVFERFYRLQAARERDSGGAGLGLAIVREVVVAHGGRAWVADCPAGAELHVRLPVG